MSYALAWTAPSLPPPTGNVSAPLNTGNTAQTKVGPITFATTTTGTLMSGGLGLITNSVTTNSITFGDLTTMNTAGVSRIIAGTNITVSPVSGTGNVTLGLLNKVILSSSMPAYFAGHTAKGGSCLYPNSMVVDALGTSMTMPGTAMGTMAIVGDYAVSGVYKFYLSSTGVDMYSATGLYTHCPWAI